MFRMRSTRLHDRPDRVVTIEIGERVSQLVDQRIVQRVRLLGAVKRDQPDPTPCFNDDIFVGHCERPKGKRVNT